MGQLCSSTRTPRLNNNITGPTNKDESTTIIYAPPVCECLVKGRKHLENVLKHPVPGVTTFVIASCNRASSPGVYVIFEVIDGAQFYSSRATADGGTTTICLQGPALSLDSIYSTHFFDILQEAFGWALNHELKTFVIEELPCKEGQRDSTVHYCTVLLTTWLKVYYRRIETFIQIVHSEESLALYTKHFDENKLATLPGYSPASQQYAK